ncbi:MAG: hypothetical protein ABI870_00710 [Rhodanobacter sp.]
MLRKLKRDAAFAESSGITAANASNATVTIATRLPLPGLEQHIALLQEPGFDGVELFYAGFVFKGWVSCAPYQASMLVY